MIDLDFTDDGDLFLNKNKSINLINDDENQVLIGILLRRLQSSIGDWDTDKAIVSSLDMFRGDALTADKVFFIKSEIYKILITDSLLDINEIEIFELPYYGTSLDFFVKIKRKDFFGNDLIFSFNYDMRMNKIDQRFINPKESLGWLE